VSQIHKGSDCALPWVSHATCLYARFPQARLARMGVNYWTLLVLPFFTLLLGWGAFYLQPRWLISALQSRFDAKTVSWTFCSYCP
jgi:hypothetical protein